MKQFQYQTDNFLHTDKLCQLTQTITGTHLVGRLSFNHRKFYYQDKNNDLL
jgi:hypothetical protein